jgi:hypothetical protein
MNISPSSRSTSARLASAARISSADLSATLSETVKIEARDGEVNCETLIRAHSRAFNAASAAAHLPSGSACMEMVEKAEKVLKAWGVSFNR